MVLTKARKPLRPLQPWPDLNFLSANLVRPPIKISISTSQLFSLTNHDVTCMENWLLQVWTSECCFQMNSTRLVSQLALGTQWPSQGQGILLHICSSVLNKEGSVREGKRRMCSLHLDPPSGRMLLAKQDQWKLMNIGVPEAIKYWFGKVIVPNWQHLFTHPDSRTGNTIYTPTLYVFLLLT